MSRFNAPDAKLALKRAHKNFLENYYPLSGEVETTIEEAIEEGKTEVTILHAVHKLDSDEIYHLQALGYELKFKYDYWIISWGEFDNPLLKT